MSLSLPRPDRFLLAIITAAVLASIFPATGAAVPVLSWASKIMIAVLFFLYGARLSPQESLEGLRNWRLHAVILSFTYLLFPLLGLALRVLDGPVLSHELYLGLLWVCLVPPTVQSSINFTSIAKGNVAGAIVSASFSNLVGVVITPLLAIALMSATGGLHIDASSVLDIVGQLLVPFVLGQLSRRWTADFVKRHKRLKLVDQGSIILVVYSAFSQGMREHMWSTISPGDIVRLVLVCLVVLALVLWLTWQVARWLGFSRADRIAIQFCGTKKSLATGVPMATVLFAGMPTVGLMVLPLMVFHQAQLMACSALAGRYARQAGETGDVQVAG
ncbi:bile acid:sodium symporter family protein [Luteococcus peritonei]|uniref:Bile acid:sodium symporter family protein n=1 Tax=Luteococcus peritonei TaxID=88874 RepID=A0ABW4RT66_9ACTN